MRSIEEIMENFVPANRREWWPWVWPDRKWFAETSKKRPSEYGDFIKQVRMLASTDLFFLCDEILRDPRSERHVVGLHDEMAHIAQGYDDVMMQIARNHWKTTVATIALAILRLATNHNHRLMIGTSEPKVRKALMDGIKQQILFNPRLRLVFPELVPAMETTMNKKRSWSAAEILVDRDNLTIKEPSITAMTVGQTLAGMHFDEHVYDDIVNSDNASSKTQLDNIATWYFATLDLLDVGGRVLIPCTPYHDNDIYSQLEERGLIAVYRRAAIENNVFIFPYQQERVLEKKRILPPSQFSAQYMCDCVSAEDQRFRPEWMKRWNAEVIREELLNNAPADDISCKEAWVDTLNLYMAIDPAWKDKAESDFMVVTTVGVDERGRMFVLEYKRGKWAQPKQRVEVVYNMWLKYRHKSIGVETYGGGAFVMEEIKRYFKENNKNYVHIFEFLKPWRENTEQTIMKLQQPLQDGMIYIGDGIEFAELEQEFIRFPKARHDDILSTLARAWSQQARKAQKDEKEEFIPGWEDRFGFGHDAENDPLQGNYSWMAV